MYSLSRKELEMKPLKLAIALVVVLMTLTSCGAIRVTTLSPKGYSYFDIEKDEEKIDTVMTGASGRRAWLNTAIACA